MDRACCSRLWPLTVSHTSKSVGLHSHPQLAIHSHATPTSLCLVLTALQATVPANREAQLASLPAKEREFGSSAFVFAACSSLEKGIHLGHQGVFLRPWLALLLCYVMLTGFTSISRVWYRRTALLLLLLPRSLLLHVHAVLLAATAFLSSANVQFICIHCV